METVLRPYLSVLAVAAATLILYLYSILWLRPEKLQRALRKQGITGPEPTLVLGNIPDMKTADNEVAPRREQSSEIVHDYYSTFFPYFGHWREIYGPIFMFSIGSGISLYVSDRDLVKKIYLSKSLDIGKTTFSNKSVKRFVWKRYYSSQWTCMCNSKKYHST